MSVWLTSVHASDVEPLDWQQTWHTECGSSSVYAPVRPHPAPVGSWQGDLELHAQSEAARRAPAAQRGRCRAQRTVMIDHSPETTSSVNPCRRRSSVRHPRATLGSWGNARQYLTHCSRIDIPA